MVLDGATGRLLLLQNHQSQLAVQARLPIMRYQTAFKALAWSSVLTSAWSPCHANCCVVALFSCASVLALPCHPLRGRSTSQAPGIALSLDIPVFHLTHKLSPASENRVTRPRLMLGLSACRIFVSHLSSPAVYRRFLSRLKHGNIPLGSCCELRESNCAYAATCVGVQCRLASHYQPSPECQCCC